VSDAGEVTEILHRLSSGSTDAEDRLYALIYQDLQRIARIHLNRERSDHTLQPADLVHESYLRLVDQTRCQWQDRAHFLSVASRAMRRILVDHARGRARVKRGGGIERIPLDEALLFASEEANTTLFALDLALDKLAAAMPEKARVAEMLSFGGLSHTECAGVLGLSPRTVARYWEYAKTWLYREMTSNSPNP
jgi:RNA polymerase sigma-70 factor, ECF subfamily